MRFPLQRQGSQARDISANVREKAWLCGCMLCDRLGGCFPRW